MTAPQKKFSPILTAIGIASLVVGLAIPIAWAVFYFGSYIGYGNWKVRGHQEFARHGVSQIQPAAEMDALFEDCRHYIVYSGRSTVSTWNSTAYFGERYVLTMQVPVDIESSRSGSMIGDPRFYLNEVDSVSASPSGGAGASFSRGIEFDAAQWKRVYDNGGDFGEIGFTIITTPVPDFKQYARASRPSN